MLTLSKECILLLELTDTLLEAVLISLLPVPKPLSGQTVGLSAAKNG